MFHMLSSVTSTCSAPADIADANAVTLQVTPNLAIPKKRMPSVPYEKRIGEIAAAHTAKGLVDQGGLSKSDAQLLQHGHYNGFISACTNAFANHYPLALRPQHFWALILQGVAKHVELNAETVRSKWVRHEGKKELVVRRDHFVLGKPNDWAGVVDGHPDSFAAQIDAHVADGVAEDLSPPLSGTTAVERTCEKITVMDVTKSFFSFKCMTMCGFPSIALEGTSDDWALLRAHAERLVTMRCEPQWAEAWLSALLPLLDKINEEYANGQRGGSVAAGDEPFWNSMCKRGGTTGSGSRTWFNGWINILFPYIAEQRNAYCVPYSPDSGYVKEGRDGGTYGMGAPRDVQGPDCADFPTGIAQAPVTWQYYNETIELAFKAGFVGASQDANSGTVRPVLGWLISHAAGEQSVMDMDDDNEPFAREVRGSFAMLNGFAKGRK